jgi:simple sugar transport system ATP-binding protein
MVDVKGGGRTILAGIDFQVRAGEIVGIAGVEGNGQSELVDVLLALAEPSGGTIVFDGTDITSLSTSERRHRGIGYIPEDRQHDGMVLNFTLWENIVLGHQDAPPFAKGPFVDRKAAHDRATQIVSRYDVRTPGVDVLALALSGGNQQKLIVGRELDAQPRLLIAAHPTRGIDVGAQAIIWDVMRGARAAGAAMLLISADLEELIGLSDSLLVMFKGRIVAELDPATVTPRDLGAYMTGARQKDAA